MKHSSWVFVSFAMLFVLESFSGHAAFAQGGGNASISGIVQDQSKALIPGVTMTSVEREGGRGTGEGSLWEQAVQAVIRGFEGAFGVATRVASRSDV